MEDVLEAYTRPYDERRPQVCLDEGSKQLVTDLREALPMEPGHPKRIDYEYDPNGYCNLFVACETLAGKRFLQVRERRTTRDWAFFVRDLIDGQYPKADKIVLVMDNLNAHSPASFYEVVEPAEAWRLPHKLEIHYTPLHGRWLNMAEIDLSVLGRQALSGRIASMQQVQARLAAWQQRRNRQQAVLQWRFTTQDARIKLERLYPKLPHEA
jgi:hypothetical protein